MLLRIIAFGVAAGLLVGIPLSIVVVASDELSMTWGMVIGYLMMLVALSLIFVAIKRQRDEAGGGVIRFWPALGMGLAISKAIVSAHGGKIEARNNPDGGATVSFTLPVFEA